VGVFIVAFGVALIPWHVDITNARPSINENKMDLLIFVKLNGRRLNPSIPESSKTPMDVTLFNDNFNSPWLIRVKNSFGRW
jgi:hypothetical protein